MPPTTFHWEHNRFVRDASYRVIKQFVDADGHEHPPGEEWRFITGMFDRQYGRVELCIGLSSGEEWILPLKWASQDKIIENYRDYFAPVPA